MDEYLLSVYKAMLENGFAHPFSIGESYSDDMNILRKVENKAGIWAKGAKNFSITSLHSQDEKPDKDAQSCV